MKSPKTQQSIFLVLILLLAAFFRLWRIDEYLPFLGDEGRDVRVVARFLKEFDLMFIGPRTSIGDMYLGPLYYYFIAPWLGLFNFSPTGPAVAVALTGVATVGFIYHAAKEWFGKTAALVSALLYAISPKVIELSKHSWNPNIMPFFALLCVYAMWRVWKNKEYKWLLVVGVSFAFVLQSHYLGLLILPTLGILWILTLIGNWKMEIGKFLRYSLASLVIFAGLMSPLFLFDYKHGGQNIRSMTIFFTHRQDTVSARPWNAIPNMWPLWKDKVVTDLLMGTKQSLWASVVAAALGVWGLFMGWKNRKSLNPMSLTVLWIMIGILGLGSLKQNIFAHYFGFLFPAPFLLIGALSQKWWENKKWAVALILGVITVFSLINNPLRHPPQRQMQRVQEIDKKIIEESAGKPFNFGLVAERNYDEGYLYFFELRKAQVRQADPQHPDETVTDQLFVVCENLPCNPTTSPKAEIAHFGLSKIDQEWEIGGIKLYKLSHNQI